MSKASKILTVFSAGVALGYFLNSDKRDEYINAARRQIRKWRRKGLSYQEELAHRYYNTDDPIDEISR